MEKEVPVELGKKRQVMEEMGLGRVEDLEEEKMDTGQVRVVDMDRVREADTDTGLEEITGDTMETIEIHGDTRSWICRCLMGQTRTVGYYERRGFSVFTD